MDLVSSKRFRDKRWAILPSNSPSYCFWESVPQGQHFRVHLGLLQEGGSCTSLHGFKMGSNRSSQWCGYLAHRDVCLGPTSCGWWISRTQDVHQDPGSTAICNKMGVGAYIWPFFIHSYFHLLLGLSFLSPKCLYKTGSLNYSEFLKSGMENLTSEQ